MKKILLGLLSLVSLLFAVNGKAIYKQHCASCHGRSVTNISKMSMMRAKMRNATNVQKQIMRKNMMIMVQNNNMKAPPIFMISKRIKMVKPNKKEFIQFIETYIQYPSQTKGYCMSMAYKRFGTMPAIGKNLTKNERIAVATWIYKSTKKYQDNMRCNFSKQKSQIIMKCGNGKCGNN